MNLKHLGQVTDSDKNLETPLFSEYVQVGWPSPADDYIEKSIDLHQLLIKAPAATYLVRASGDSMLNAGINNGAILIVDRSLEPKHGDIVIASVDGAYACKRLQLVPKVGLLSENIKYPPIFLKNGQELDIMGVVTAAINQF